MFNKSLEIDQQRKFPDQCSGDSSHRHVDRSIETRFQPEPGSTLATAIGEEQNPLISETSRDESDVQSIHDVDQMKYKTELCRNFTAFGFCSYSSRCQFAHGPEELRYRTRHPKYKTELCRNFLAGFCKYGSRCQFLHRSNETKETDPTATVAALGTYLLTNIIAQSAALAAFTANENFQSRTTMPFQFASQIYSPLQLSSNHFFISQNQNSHEKKSSSSEI